MTEGKLLEVEEVPDRKGVTDAEATFNVVTACRAVESLRALLFDTTSSNTGVYKGAAIVLMTKIGRVLLWFECRHHMAELFIKPVWILLFGDDSGPFRSDFSLFKKVCPYIEKKNLVVLTVNPGLEEELKESTVKLLTNILIIPNNKSQLPTDNYKEMLELTLRVLGADVPGGFKIRKCGANDKVRFMVDIIYGMKMFLLQNLVVDEKKMEEDGVSMDIEFDDEYKAALTRFVKLSSLVYVPYFMKSSIGADAPVNDLELIHLLLKYREIDAESADAALTAMRSRHLYYLTEENVVMSLFSNRINDDQKSRIASRILTFSKPGDFKMAKPKHMVSIDKTTTLESLVGANSWTLFHVLDTKSDWLHESPSKWPENADYIETRDWVRTAKVVNDSCERGVKMIQDFSNTLTSDTEIRKGLLKAVAASREQYPEFSKKTLNATLDAGV